MVHGSRLDNRFDFSIIARILLSLIIGAVLLMISVTTAAAVAEPAASTSSTNAAEVEVTGGDDEADSESVTIKIPVDEGGSIDLESDPGDVQIDTWDGDDVLLVVEKTPSANPGAGLTRPVNIEVKRHAGGIRISAHPYSSGTMQGYDISYRLMVPRATRVTYASQPSAYDLSKVTSVVWKALTREALHWLLR